jgi:hypothetical protein
MMQTTPVGKLSDLFSERICSVTGYQNAASEIFGSVHKLCLQTHRETDDIES